MTMKIVIILNNHELYGKHNITFWPRQKALKFYKPTSEWPIYLNSLRLFKNAALFLFFTALHELALWSMKITFSFVHRKTLFNNAKESKEIWDEDESYFTSDKDSGNILSYQMSASY